MSLNIKSINNVNFPKGIIYYLNYNKNNMYIVNDID